MQKTESFRNNRFLGLEQVLDRWLGLWLCLGIAQATGAKSSLCSLPTNLRYSEQECLRCLSFFETGLIKRLNGSLSKCSALDEKKNGYIYNDISRYFALMQVSS